jgi:hypothetical protein
MSKVVKLGERQYEFVEGWGDLPDGWKWGQCAAVACDSEDNVHVFTRTDHPHMVFDKSGKLIDHWGEQLFEYPHGICVTANDDIFFVETTTHIVTKFNKHGKHLMTLGTRHTPSDSGYTQEVRDPNVTTPSGNNATVLNGVARGAGPFNRPTDLSIADNGDIFISDGYQNSRVHKFSADGTLLKSIGEPGHARDLRNTKDGPGLFHTPHGIWVHKDRVYVSDRENYRIQVFTRDLEFIDIWTGFERPTKLYVDEDEVMYVSELENRFSLVKLDGSVIGSYGTESGHEPGMLWGPHGIWADSEDSIYVAEVLSGARLQKLARKR